MMTKNGKHSISMKDEVFEVDVKYVPIKVLGDGVDGVVCSCENVETGGKVAVKKIRDPFRKALAAIRAVQEMQILRQVQHPNVVSISDVMLSSDSRDVYLVEELMDMDLFDVLRFPLSDELIRGLLRQIVMGVGHLHSVGVIHRDLKPENLLIEKANSRVKIGDLGHARTVKEGGLMTDLVGSMWYRAPELLYGSNKYTKAVDMWSVGCIFGQMLGQGRPMFMGEGPVGQINEVLRVLGTPKDLSYVKGEMARKYLKGLRYQRGIRLWKLYPEAHRSAIDLLEMMLELEPRKRITAEEALRHPYFASLGLQEFVAAPPPSMQPVKVDIDEDDPELVDVEDVREIVRKEVLFYQSQVWSILSNFEA